MCQCTFKVHWVRVRYGLGLGLGLAMGVLKITCNGEDLLGYVSVCIRSSLG